MIFSKVSKGTSEFNSLSWAEDADGRLRIWANAPSGCTAKTPVQVGFNTASPFGYMAQLNTLGTATGAWFYVGVPEKTLTSAQSGFFTIGGVCSQTILGSSITGSAGIGVQWSSASGLVSMAASSSSSLVAEDFVAGIFAFAQSAATTTHDIYLFGILTKNGG